MSTTERERRLTELREGLLLCDDPAQRQHIEWIIAELEAGAPEGDPDWGGFTPEQIARGLTIPATERRVVDVDSDALAPVMALLLAERDIYRLTLETIQSTSQDRNARAQAEQALWNGAKLADSKR